MYAAQQAASAGEGGGAEAPTGQTVDDGVVDAEVVDEGPAEEK